MLEFYTDGIIINAFILMLITFHITFNKLLLFLSALVLHFQEGELLWHHCKVKEGYVSSSR